MSRRIEGLKPYLFVEINNKIAEKKARGEEVISFAIGDPDTPTPENIINRFCQSARDPANHHYPETVGLPELRQAIATEAARLSAENMALTSSEPDFRGIKPG